MTRLRAWLHALLPHSCLACDAPLGAEAAAQMGLCDRCHRDLEPAAQSARGDACRTCGCVIVGMSPAHPLCGACQAQPPPFAALHVAWRYAPPLDRVIAAMKFERLDYLGGQLGAAVTQRPWFRDLAADVRARRGARPFDAVVPVPLHAWRRFRRGHDQARGIAEPIAAALGVPCRNLLRRRRATAPQSARDEAERRRNVRDAFVCRGPQRGKTVLLVDDVYTTGSTLIAAARPLVRAGATVEALVVARTPRWDEVPGVE